MQDSPLAQKELYKNVRFWPAECWPQDTWSWVIPVIVKGGLT